MDNFRWRSIISGLVFLTMGLGGMAYFYLQWNFDVPLLFLMAGVLTVGGSMLLSGRFKYHYYLLPILGGLALVKSVGYYLNYGLTTLTLLFVILGVISAGKFAQAYWSSETENGIEA